MNTVNLNQADYEYVIFAAQPNPPEKTMQFLLDNNIDFQVILGSYKGEPETSFCIPFNRFADVGLSGLIDEQESVLFLGPIAQHDGSRPAYFLYSEATEPVSVGNLVQVDRSTAEASDGYSYSLMAKAFFTIVPVAENEQPAEDEAPAAQGE